MDVTAVHHLPLTIELTTLIQQAQQTLRERQPIAPASSAQTSIVVSVVERVWAQEAISLFARGGLVTDERFLYSRPGEAFSLAGFGVATAISGVGAARFRQTATARLRLLADARMGGRYGLPGTGPLFFGGFTFDPQRSATGLWQGFEDGRLVMPRVLYTQQDGEAYLTINILVSLDSNPINDAAEAVALWQELIALPTLTAAEQPDLVGTQELRPGHEWQADVARATAVIRRGDLDKTVLARGLHLQAARPIDLGTALNQLTENYPHCHIFAVVRGDQCFLGATPERLVQLVDRRVTTMSLAGSIRRGKTPDEDRSLGAALIASAKDRYEHGVVVREIVESLRGYVDNLQFEPTPVLLKLGNVQHLCTPIAGDLVNGYSVLDLVGRLHPTPAVGGRPREAALKLIRDLEGLDRGWYAAPLGWIDATGGGEFVVALRSALVRGDQATLFAGCGIVGDSVPEQEYAESNLKLRPMLSALAAH